MTTDTDHQLEQLTSRLLELDPGDVPLVTATIDLRPGKEGQPTALHAITQMTRDARETLGNLDRERERSFEQDIEALTEAIETASSDGSLGLVYCGAAASDILTVIETPYPLRNGIHAGKLPRLFELMRTRYLAGRPVCLVTTDVHTMDITRVRYGAGEDNDSVEWSKHFLSKHGQRTRIEGAGAPLPGAGGHAMSRVQSYVEHQRALFAREAAQHIESFTQPGDLLVVAGPEEARAQLLNSLPERYQQEAVETTAIDPTQDEREHLHALTGFVVDAQYRRAAEEVDRWSDGAHGELALRGYEAIAAATETGQVGVLILHEDAIDHYGTFDDARYQEPPHDPDPVEELLQAALRQGADVWFTTDARVQEQHGGVIAIARFSLDAAE